VRVLGTDRLTFWGIRGYSGHGQHAVTRVLGTALRLLIIALRVPITALRVPMIALRVLGTALRLLIIALRVAITALRVPMIALRVPITALRVPMIALRVPITALRVPITALRVLGTALRQLIIALRVPITRGAGGGRRVRRRVGWLKDRGARCVDKRKPIPWITESQRCGFLLRAHCAGCGADGKERERLGGADNKALTDAGLGTVLSDSLRSLNLSNCSRSVSGIHWLHGHASAHAQRAVASGRVTGRVT
jgi:hypothetical protein